MLSIAVVILLRFVTALWAEHMADCERDRIDRDAMRELLRKEQQNNADAIAAWNKRNEQDAARQRRADGRP